MMMAEIKMMMVEVMRSIQNLVVISQKNKISSSFVE
jgi:hypothetical protein